MWKYLCPAIIVCSALYAWHAYSERQSRDVIAEWGDHPGSTIYLDRLPALTFYDLRENRRQHIRFQKDSYYLMVFLSPADCWGCMGELPAWKQLSREQEPPTFEEYFIFVSTSLSETHALVQDGMFSTTSHLLLDTGKAAQLSLKIPSTPFTVLIRGSDQHVLSTEGPDSSLRGEEQFVSAVASQIHIHQ